MRGRGQRPEVTECQQVGSLAWNCVCTKVTFHKQDFNFYDLLTYSLTCVYMLPLQIQQHYRELTHVGILIAAVACHKQRSSLSSAGLLTGSDVCFLWIVADKSPDDGQACSCLSHLELNRK